MRLRFIVCKVLQREAYLCAARSKNVVDIVLMPKGLHDQPERLTEEVQKQLEITEDVQGRPYDAVLLGYALCSNGINGLKPKIPLVVTRGHDCITILLGSMKRYKEYFDSHRGVYWYSPGWIESNDQPSKERYLRMLEEYKKKYGEDNAEFLMEMEQSWMKEYGWATYVDWGFGEQEHFKDYTREAAEFFKWKYDEIRGEQTLMQKLVDGEWNESEFLKVMPGQKIVADLTDPGLVRAEPV